MPPDLERAYSAFVEALPLAGTGFSKQTLVGKPIWNQISHSASPATSMLELHRCRLIDWSPSPIVALAPSVDGTVIAAARDSGDVEIWRVAAGSVGWTCELRIPGRKEAAISSLVWCLATRDSPRGRLFSAGLDGHITEWDLSSLSPKAVVDSYGGPIWNMAVEPEQPRRGDGPGQARESSGEEDEDEESDTESRGTSGGDEESEDETEGTADLEHAWEEQRLAVACDDGCVRLFTASAASGLQFRRALPKVAGRVLSVAWNRTATRLFAGGSDGCIRCWDVGTMQEVYRMTAGTGGLSRKDDLCVWSLLVLRDETVVSGDGSGATQFWDGTRGTLLQAQTRHKADVLTLAAAPSHDAVYAAGIDGQVVLFQRLSEPGPAAAQGRGQAMGSAGTWAYVGGRRAHSHDVRALAVAVLPSAEQEERVEEQGRRKQRRGGRKGHKGGKREPSKERPRWQKPGVPMLVSGGNDAQLFTYPAESFMAFYPHAVCPAPQIPPMHLTTGVTPGGKPLLLVQQPRSVDIWRLDQGGAQVAPEGSLEEGTNSGERRGEDGGRGGLVNGMGTAPRMNGVLGKRKGAGEKVEERVPKKAAGIRGHGLANGLGPVAPISGVGSGAAKGMGPGSSSSSRQGPVLVARIKSSAAEHIACSAVSPNGRFLVFSDWAKLRLYELEQPTGKQQQKGRGKGAMWAITRRKLPAGLPPAHEVVFSADSSRLVLAARNGGISVVDIEEEEVLHQFSPYSHFSSSGFLSAEMLPPATRLLCTSRDGQWLAAADSCGNLSIFNLETMRHHWAVPSLDGSSPTALLFHPWKAELVVATSANQLHGLDVEAKGMASWSKANGGQMPKELLELPGGITGLSMGAREGTTKLVAYSSRYMCHVDLSKPLIGAKETSGKAVDEEKTRHVSAVKPHTESKEERKMRQRQEQQAAKLSGEQSSGKSVSNLRIVPFKDHALFVGHLGESSLLVVEKAWEEVLMQLPVPMYYHKYGT